MKKTCSSVNGGSWVKDGQRHHTRVQGQRRDLVKHKPPGKALYESSHSATSRVPPRNKSTGSFCFNLLYLIAVCENNRRDIKVSDGINVWRVSVYNFISFL